MTAASVASLPIASLPEVRQLIDSAARRHPGGGVLGLRAQLTWSGATELQHAGMSVRIVLCPSALAVREALRGRDRTGWLVVITDRDEHDLGVGIRAHLIEQRLRNPDPWGAVRDQFAATRVDRRLVTDPRHRDLAAGLLAARGEQPWLPARGGLLGYDHAMGSVAGRWFELGEATDPSAEDVLRWTTRSGQDGRATALRQASNDTLADRVLAWLAGRCGRAAELVAAVVASGKLADLVPLGVAARAVLACPDDSAPWTRLETQYLGDRVRPTRLNLAALVDAAEHVLSELMHDVGDDSPRHVGRLLTRADDIVEDLRADAGAHVSDLLRRGLSARLDQVGERLHQIVRTADSRAAAGVDLPLVDAAELPSLEDALASVNRHGLARTARERHDHRIARAQGGVRLARWLSQDVSLDKHDLVGLMQRHRDVDAWVDWAYADAWRGVDEQALARGLEAVTRVARLRRDEHDLRFAQGLAAAAATPSALPDDVVVMESLLAQTVVPLAQAGTPVLLVVADGMSASVSAEVVEDVERRYDTWVECLPTGRERRTAAVAVLPSLTEVSRCSLLSGTLAVGGQTAEQRGFRDLLTAHGLTGSLLHRLVLDSSGAGSELSDAVRATIGDVEGQQVVACVLNSIDDALDRTDPGIDWTAEAVTHLRPLLESARRAGRVVVLTSDHGHVIERREGRQVTVNDTSSNRSHAFNGQSPEEGALRVQGARVLSHDADAVLAYDERLRFGPKKAGYHGGAAPAEVVVPVHVLTPGAAPDGYQLAVPQSPAWWRAPVRTAATETPILGPTVTVLPKASDETPTLFDEVEVSSPPVDDLAAAVMASEVWAQQRQRATRVALRDEQVAALLRLLLGSTDHRADAGSAAAALGVNQVQLAGALPMVQRLLNVEQYPVLDRDSDGVTVILDVALLTEQFGVAR